MILIILLKNFRWLFADKEINYKFAPAERANSYLENVVKLSHGVTGNTFGFGPKESRFEP